MSSHRVPLPGAQDTAPTWAPGLADHPMVGPSWSQCGGQTWFPPWSGRVGVVFSATFEVSKEEQLCSSRVSLFCGLSLFSPLDYCNATSCMTN